MYFEYGEKEISYLKGKDQKLKEVIEQIGPIKRTVDADRASYYRAADLDKGTEDDLEKDA
jgi:hypothetical protein